MEPSDLTEAERLDLMRFMCSFAWADGEVQPQERKVLEQVLAGLDLGDDARAQASEWLSEPPDMDGFDFAAIDEDTRSLFIDEAFAVAAADGGLAPEELQHLKSFMRFGKSAD